MSISAVNDSFSTDTYFDELPREWETIKSRYQEITPHLKSLKVEIDNRKLEQSDPSWGLRDGFKMGLSVAMVLAVIIARVALVSFTLLFLTEEIISTTIVCSLMYVWCLVSTTESAPLGPLYIITILRELNWIFEAGKLYPLPKLEAIYSQAKVELARDIQNFLLKVRQIGARHFFGETALIPPYLKNSFEKFKTIADPIFKEAQELRGQEKIS